MITKSMKIPLNIELVPSPSWYNNLRKYASKEDWDKIRKAAYADSGHKCGICGVKEILNCHEIWEYDDKNHIQRLVGFIALCDMCHHVKHIGNAKILASKGYLDYEKVVQHFMKVNSCNRDLFKKHREEAFEQWKRRSSYEWQVDFGEYKNITKGNSKSPSPKPPKSLKTYRQGKGKNSFRTEIKIELELCPKVKLKDALELYKKEERAPSNSYEWYRKSAQERGIVPIGDMDVPVYKEGIWYVEDKKFAEAIKQHRETIKHLKQVTADYAKGIIHGKDRDVVSTEWGGYTIRRNFRFVWSDYERFHQKSYGTWYCNKCNTPSETEHNKEACHLCSDWNGCGKDCTLSKVYCPNCGKSTDI